MHGKVKTKDLVLLWGRAAGRCCHPDCKIRLVLDASGDDDAVSVGQAAHMVARRPAGPRGDGARPAWRVNDYENLILLCGYHHAMVDRQAGTHTVEELRVWKAEHEAWVRAVTESAPPSVPWTVIVQEEERRMDVEEARLALGGGNQVVAMEELCSSPAKAGWTAAARGEREAVEELLARTPEERRRFAVFSMGRIPLAIQLGYLLGDRARVALYHYDRDRGSWAWPEGPAAGGGGGRIEGSEFTKLGKGGTARIRVSLSARIAMEDVGGAAWDVEIGVDEPSVRWLRRAEQLTELARVFGRTLEEIRGRMRCERIHLYYAGPAAGAICLGRAYNPRMNPPLQLYEYRRGARPAYEAVAALNENGGG